MKTDNKLALVNKNEDILSNGKVVADEINRFLKMQGKKIEINENIYFVNSSNGITDSKLINSKSIPAFC